MARSVSFLQELIRIPPVGRRHRHPQPRKGVKRRELHICVLRRHGLRVPHAASGDDKIPKNFPELLEVTL
jgi:hypothetical protein